MPPRTAAKRYVQKSEPVQTNESHPAGPSSGPADPSATQVTTSGQTPNVPEHPLTRHPQTTDCSLRSMPHPEATPSSPAIPGDTNLPQGSDPSSTASLLTVPPVSSFVSSTHAGTHATPLVPPLCLPHRFIPRFLAQKLVLAS